MAEMKGSGEGVDTDLVVHYSSVGFLPRLLTALIQFVLYVASCAYLSFIASITAICSRLCSCWRLDGYGIACLCRALCM